MKIHSLSLNNKKFSKILKGKIKKIFSDEPVVRDALLMLENKPAEKGFNLSTHLYNLMSALELSDSLLLWAFISLLEHCSLDISAELSSLLPSVDQLSAEQLESFFSSIFLHVTSILHHNYNRLNYSEKLTGIRDWLANVPQASIQLKDMELEQAVIAAKEWHDSLQVSNIQVKTAEGRILKKYPDGHYWVDLECKGPTRNRQRRSKDKEKQDFSAWNQCDYEAEMMGHCANSKGWIVSLRIDGVAHLTASVDFENGVLYQLKAKGNSKPPSKYHKYIIDLLIDPATGLKTYDPEYLKIYDFNIFDLNNDLFQEILNHNPNICTSFVRESSLDVIKDSLVQGNLSDQNLYDLFISGEFRGDYIVTLYNKDIITSETVQDHFDTYISKWVPWSIIKAITHGALPGSAVKDFHTFAPNWNGWDTIEVTYILEHKLLDIKSIHDIVINSSLLGKEVGFTATLFKEGVFSQTEFVEFFSNTQIRLSVVIRNFYIEDAITRDTLRLCLEGVSVNYALFGIFRYLYLEKIFTVEEIRDIMGSCNDSAEWLNLGYLPEDYPYAVKFGVMDKDFAIKRILYDLSEVNANDFRSLYLNGFVSKNAGLTKLANNLGWSQGDSYSEIKALYEDKLIDSDELSYLVEFLGYKGVDESNVLVEDAVNGIITKSAVQKYIKYNETELSVSTVLKAFEDNIISNQIMSGWLGDNDLSIHNGLFKYKIGYLWESDIKEWFSSGDRDIIDGMVEGGYIDYFYDYPVSDLFNNLDEKSLTELKELFVDKKVISKEVAESISDDDLKTILLEPDVDDGISYNLDALNEIGNDIESAFQGAANDAEADAYYQNIERIYLDFLENDVFTKLKKNKAGTWVGYIDPFNLLETGDADECESVRDTLYEMFSDSNIFNDVIISKR